LKELLETPVPVKVPPETVGTKVMAEPVLQTDEVSPVNAALGDGLTVTHTSEVEEAEPPALVAVT
jgi:hypothetical protein